MKKRLKNNNDINFFTKNKKAIILILIVFVTCFMTVGYAAYQQLLSFSGNATFKKVSAIEITDVSLVSSSNVITSLSPDYSGTTIDFNIDFNGVDTTYEAVYSVTVTNETTYDYIYSEVNFNSLVTTTSGTGTGNITETVSGISNGDTIAAGATVTFYITFTLDVTDQTSTYNLTSTASVNLTKDVTGSLLASVSPSSGNLQSPNTQTSFTITVINTYTFSRTFSFSLGNSNFYISGSSSHTIAANTTQSYTVNVKASSSAIFLTNSENTSLILSANGLANINVGTLTLAVDIYVEPDTTIPEIGPVSLAISNTSGSFTVDWTRLDSGGTSIVNYTVLLYNSSNTLVSTRNTNSDATSYTFTGISEGTYYVKVYGTDEAGNTGSGEVSSATTSTVHCRKSNSYTMQWTFNVTNNLTNISSNGASTASLGSTYTATLSTSGNFYSLPSSITVKMGSTTLISGTGYTWTKSTGALSIPNVTGALTITATATSSCLVEGTKIMLADKTTKNIEDINYNDLLLTWNYETGSFTYEYPIWLEKESVSNKYQLIKFSDGSSLKVVGKHGVFDLDSNLFVSTNDETNFKVGTKVAKINSKKNGFDYVTVTSIEIKYEKVNYYHVVATRYYNVIANNILTTDGTVILSNLYGFTNQITWPYTRSLIMSDSNNLYKYSELKNIIPYYMYKGMRIEEAKYLSVFGLTKDIFIGYLLENQVKDEMWLKPMTNSKNQNLWMVTTSDDIVTNKNKNNYLVVEGSFYQLKSPKLNSSKKFMGWYNTTDGKYYKVNDLVRIYTGTHFVAVWK